MSEDEEIETKNPISFQPLENIALAFSGGGYRASAFSLGILSYFNHINHKGKPLLSQLNGLSTVSGGTITGAFYADSLANGKSFEEFYAKLYGFMQEDKIMSAALSELEDDTTWKEGHKKRSLINAFAISYKKMLTDGTMGQLKTSSLCHIDDVIFNATEFQNGNPFRFTASRFDGKFGNGDLSCIELKAVEDDILIADAIASSSCFPMGFEPIIFPEDFIENKGEKFEALKKTPQFIDSVGLMDGGIVDNQGIESILLADKRRRRQNKQFGLLMVCDVSSPFMENWRGFVEKESTGWRANSFNSLKQLLPESFWWKVLGPAVTIAGFLMLFITRGFAGMNQCNYGDLHLLSGILITLGVLLLVLKYSGRLVTRLVKVAVVDRLMKALPPFIRSQLFHFGNLRFSLLETMVQNRISSVEQMVSEVFMKRVRSLTYYQVYTNSDWKFRRSSCMIYDLTDKGIEWRRVKVGRLNKYLTETMKDPGSKIKNAAYIAYKMPTTLWFDAEDRRIRRLESLVACGQFTVCFSLMLYLRELDQAADSPHKGCLINDPYLKATYDTIAKDWEEFRKNPYWLTAKS